ncbi:succinate dehydrogenase, cytochrome b556 subunit [Thalassotalea sp. Y01]|nr:succinate dehydrogenase, cytochrome b556 subunit [Thalassotalea sp. Y01]QBY05624.1 succinate dehydrogenase, cytochrome b556 subunit [Thalassotalea sp. HSM 43]
MRINVVQELFLKFTTFLLFHRRKYRALWFVKLENNVLGKITVNKQRPVNLDLATIKLPAAAKASILHRVSGVMMFFGVGILIWALSVSLSSPEGFASVKECFTGALGKFIVWGIITALAYHFVGGIRHLIMDLGHLEEKGSGQASARFAIALWVVLAVLAGVWVW